jgi:preprotein translocase subunit SecA
MGKESLKDEFLDYFDGETDLIVDSQRNVQTDELEIGKISEIAKSILPLSKEQEKLIQTQEPETAKKNLKKILNEGYETKEKEIGESLMRMLEHGLYLRTIDMLWVDHLDAMEHLREGIGLRGYGQKDPLIEYKNESYDMFQKLLGAIQSEIVNTFFKVTIHENPPVEMPEGEVQKDEREAVERKVEQKGNSENVTSDSSAVPSDSSTVIPSEQQQVGESLPVESPQTNESDNQSTHKKIGRNDPCPCGSGKKYKKCCGK